MMFSTDVHTKRAELRQQITFDKNSFSDNHSEQV